MYATEISLMKESSNAANFIAAWFLEIASETPAFQQLPPWSVSNQQHWSRILHQQKNYDSRGFRWYLEIFSSKVFLN